MSVPNEVIESARAFLSANDAALKRANDVVPLFEWRHRAGGFSGLVSLIIEQQVSVASARAIWRKFETAIGGVSVKAVLSRTIDELKLFGLSAPKARYVRGIAEAHERGEINLEELKHLSDDAASEKLMALHGIGRWTAEAYLMGCEARTDVFPAADIALQEAVRILDGAASRPSTEELYARSERWQPYRSIAAHLLWAYYTGVKDFTILMPQGVPPMVKFARSSAAKQKVASKRGTAEKRKAQRQGRR